jgi:hypothetical protein
MEGFIMKFDDDIKGLKPHIKISIQMERNAAREKARKLTFTRVDSEDAHEDVEAEESGEKAEIFEAIDIEDDLSENTTQDAAPRRRGRPKKRRH